MSDSMAGYTCVELRNYCGLTQFAFAEMLGLSQSAISQMERKGESAPKWLLLAVKGALFTHNGLSGCMCRYCHKSRLDAVYSR